MKRLFAALLVCALSATAGDVTTSVSYVSATAVYLNAGSASGVAVGDSVTILRDRQIVARLVVSFVSAKSASCESHEVAPLTRKDDVAVVRISDTAPVESVANAEDHTGATLTTAAGQSTQAAVSQRANRLSGRIGIDYAVQSDREAVNLDYTEPALNARITLSKIGGSDVSARTNVKLRKTSYGNDRSDVSSHRIYEAQLVYEPESGTVEAGLGRTIVRETRGMGYLDGVYLKYRVSSAVKAGVAAGVEPNLQNTEYRTDVTKAALFVAFDKPFGTAHAIDATAAFAGRYYDGEVSREFFYQQLAYAYSQKLRIFESTEINLNRGWLKDAEGSTLTVASFLFDAWYSVSRAFAVSLGYDNRTNFYTAETRSVPDSLFHNALQTGYRLSAETRFARGYSADAGLGVRESSGDAGQSTSGWARVGTSDAAGTLAAAYARLRWYDSDYSAGYQPAITLARDLVRWLRLELEGGLNRYELTEPKQTVATQWAAMAVDLEIARRSYAAVEYEQGFGDGRDASWLRVALGTRF